MEAVPANGLIGDEARPQDERIFFWTFYPKMKVTYLISKVCLREYFPKAAHMEGNDKRQETDLGLDTLTVHG